MPGIYENNAKYEKPRECVTDYEEIQDFYTTNQLINNNNNNNNN